MLLNTNMMHYDNIAHIISSDKISGDACIGGFSTRGAGDCRELSNIVKFLKENEIDYSQIVTLEQIHSVNVAHYAQSSDLSTYIHIEETDGVVTTTPHVVLTVQTADCVPMIFTDNINCVVGISHQGWRGSLRKMPEYILCAMEEHGAQRKNISVAIGPSIGPCCYHIDESRYYEFMEEFDRYDDQIFTIYEGKRHLNLSLLNYLVLLEGGIKKEQIDYIPFCTYCDKERFFSFRRDKKNFKEMISFIMLHKKRDEINRN